MNDLFKSRMSILGKSEGECRRHSSKEIMERSFSRDPACKKVYVKWIDSGLPWIDNEIDIPVDAKFNVKSYHNVTSDEIAYLLQFRYEDMQSNPNIKVGSYVYIPNELGDYEWWLIVHLDDRTQFRQFSILKCSWVYKWVSVKSGKREIYQCLGAPRKQNSYNSGVWLDYTTQTVENQEVMWLPTNSDTVTIMYDTGFLRSSPGRYPPLKWKVSKIEDTATIGISRFTMTQEQFDPNRDNYEEMIADYWDGSIAPTPQCPDTNEYKIKYSNTPSVRAGGGYKKFTFINVDHQDEVIDSVEWEIDFGEFNNKLEHVISDNYIKIKCSDDYSLIGKTFNLVAKYNGYTKCLVVEVASL